MEAAGHQEDVQTKPSQVIQSDLESEKNHSEFVTSECHVLNQQ